MRASGWKSLLAALAAYLLLAGMYVVPDTRAWLDAIEIQAINLRFDLRGVRQPATDFRVLGLTEEVLAAFEDHGVYYPFPRNWHALALKRLADAGARIIVVDILFSAAGSWDESEDAVLRDAISYCQQQGCAVVLAAAIEQRQYAQGVRSETLVLPADTVLEAQPALGLANTHTKLSFKLYEYTSLSLPLGEAGDPVSYYTQASQAALLHWQRDGISAELAQKRLERDGGAYRINYLGPPRGFPQLYYDYIVLFPEMQLGSGGVARELTTAEQGQLSRLIDGCTVFIGSRNKADNDYFETPYGQMYGVDTIAQAYDTRVGGVQVGTLPPLVLLGIALALSLAAWLLSLRRPIWLVVLVAAGATVLLLAANQLAFAWLTLELYLPLTAGSFVLAFTACTVYEAISEEAAKRQLRSTFSRYVSPEIVEQIVSNPEAAGLHGVERKVAVMFNDIRSYSTITEQMSPVQVVEFLNLYLGEASQIIRSQRGTVDKYLGDGLMAFFGAPVVTDDPAGDAIAAALEIVEVLHTRLVPRLEERGLPVFKIGIGIHYGAAVVGNIGSEQRMEYTLIGDAVNVAARVESQTKEVGAAVLVTEEVRQACQREFSFESAGQRMVKGRSQAVRLYSVSDPNQPDLYKL